MIGETPRSWNTAARVAVGVGVVGIVVLWVGARDAPATFYSAYVVAYLFWLGLSLGGLALLMVHHLVGGRWGFGIQRLLEAAAATLPLMAVAFLPIFLGMQHLYGWVDVGVRDADPVLLHKAPYLNPTFWAVRAAIYFAVWIALAWLLRAASRRQDVAPQVPTVDRMKSLSGPGLVAYVLTMSFAAIDWGMARDPHWFSTIYGLIFVVSQGLSILAFALLLLPLWRRQPHVAEALDTDRVHDLGTLLFAFVMLWGYMEVSQFLIIWMGNLPEEIGWYLQRIHGAWGVLALVVIAVQLALPFLLLLFRRIKRNVARLGWVAALVLLGRFPDLFWMVKPTAEHPGLHLHWLDVVAPLALGGPWIAMFLWALTRGPLMPHGDPRWRELQKEVVSHG